MFSKLTIISNESILKEQNSFYCDNIDIKSIPEGLKNNFDVFLIARNSKLKRSHEINLKSTKLASNIFSFLINVLKSLKNKETKYLIISITPHTFFAAIILYLFRRKFFVYLRSNGYEEWRCILGFFGTFLYHIMFSTVSKMANLISCRPHLLNGRSGKIVSPSQLSEKWFLSHKKAELNKVKLLYVGRIRIEKGVFSLLKIFNNLSIDAKLSIVGVGKYNSHTKINQKNVNVIDFENKNDSIIDVYDSNNIFILPSFSEAHPQVLDESLSRLRPVIIFEEISHVIGNRKGIFVTKRNSKSLSNTINYVIKNYESIQNKIKENVLPTKSNFLQQMSNLITES